MRLRGSMSWNMLGYRKYSTNKLAKDTYDKLPAEKFWIVFYQKLKDEFQWLQPKTLASKVIWWDFFFFQISMSSNDDLGDETVLTEFCLSTRAQLQKRIHSTDKQEQASITHTADHENLTLSNRELPNSFFHPNPRNHSYPMPFP